MQPTHSANSAHASSLILARNVKHNNRNWYTEKAARFQLAAGTSGMILALGARVPRLNHRRSSSAVVAPAGRVAGRLQLRAQLGIMAKGSGQMPHLEAYSRWDSNPQSPP